MRIDILSLFPDYFQSPFNESIIGRARRAGLIELGIIDIRDFAKGDHRVVDDRPYGGGPGMVLKPEPVADAIRSCRSPEAHVVYLSPQGEPLSAAKCRELSNWRHLILLCGHYEGVDQRVLETEVDESISIGDYVLTNGCLPAIVVVDAVARFIPGVLGDERAAGEDSFEKGIFDCPHYTRPKSFEGHPVPEALLSGSHVEIAHWRREQALSATEAKRSDLFWSHLSRCSEELGLADHTLLTRDAQLAWRFYRDAMGWKRQKVTDWGCRIEGLGLSINLLEGKFSHEPSLGPVLQYRIPKGHSIEAWKHRWERKGIPVLSIGGEKERVQLTDPDGYVWWVST